MRFAQIMVFSLYIHYTNYPNFFNIDVVKTHIHAAIVVPCLVWFFSGLNHHKLVPHCAEMEKKYLRKKKKSQLIFIISFSLNDPPQNKQTKKVLADGAAVVWLEWFMISSSWVLI